MNEQFMQKTAVVWAGALLSCALWGSAIPCIKLGYEWMQIGSSDTWTQILFAGCRFTLAGILTVIAGSFFSRKMLIPSREAVPKVLSLCMLQTVIQYLFFYIGVAHTDGTKSAIIVGMNVFVSILVASLIFRQEKMTMRKVAGCLIGFMGIVLINSSGIGGGFHMTLTGEGFVFLSTVSYAFSSVVIKKYSKTENPLMLSGWQFVFGGLIMAAGGFLMGGRLSGWSVKSGAMLVYLAFVSAAAYSVWSLLLKYNPVSRVSVFGFMNPVFSFTLSAILLKEHAAFSVISVASLVLVCIGIYIVNANGRSAGKS